MTYILQLINGGTYIITPDQKKKLTAYIEAGSPKSFMIGENVVLLHQVCGICTQDAYVRQMEEKLSHTGKALCRSCLRAHPYGDKCACKTSPERFPPLLESARRENPQLAIALNAAAKKMSLPSPNHD
jgi:hypothetical protein